MVAPRRIGCQANPSGLLNAVWGRGTRAFGMPASTAADDLVESTFRFLRVLRPYVRVALFVRDQRKDIVFP